MQTLHHSARMPHQSGVLLQLSPKWNDTVVERIIQLRLHFSARWRACPYFKTHPSILWEKFASDCRVTQAQWMAYPQPWSQPPRYGIWSILEKRVFAVKIRDVEHLCNRLGDAWAGIKQEEVDKVIGSFIKRVKVCIEANGHGF